MNPWLKHVVHQGQGNTGTCVGQTGAYGANINYIQLTKDLPTDADWQHVKFNVRLDPNNPNSTTYYDVLLPKSFSMAYSYWKSREKCNVTVPSGSYVSCACKSWKEDGMCLNDQWLLSKDGRTAWRTPYPDKHPVTGETVAQFAPKHKIDGYASIMTAQGVKDAISRYGFVPGAIDVYENFTQIDPNTGIFPEPKGSVIGGHALCFIGYDANYLYCLHSWRDELPAKIGGISWSYFSVGAIEFFTILDSEESKIIVTPTPTPPVSNFTATPESGEVPLTVHFKDTSTGTVDARIWKFGDGTADVVNAPAEVDHQYTTTGTFTATLTVSNAGGSSTMRKTISVNAPPIVPPVAKIEAAPTSGVAPLTVQFTDKSTGNVIDRLWEFGDGTTSNASAPQHTYQTANTYTAKLTVQNQGGQSTDAVAIAVTTHEPTPWERFIAWLIEIFSRIFGNQSK